MKLILKSLIYIFLLSYLPIHAQEQAAAVPFLAFPADARTTAMGTGGTALPGDVAAVFRNASVVMFDKTKSAFGYSFAPWNRDWVSGSNLHTLGAIIG